MERLIIMGFVRCNSGLLTEEEIVERLSDPATEHRTQETLAQLLGEGVLVKEKDRIRHADQ